MNIPQSFIKQFKAGKRLFSYSDCLGSERTTWAIFLSLDNSATKDTFYWQNPDDSDTLLGVGQLLQFKGAEADFAAIVTAQQLIKNSLYQESVTPDGGALLCGAWAFDPLKKSEPSWGDIGQNFFFLPEILFRQKNGQCYLTLTLTGETEAELVENWQTLWKIYQDISKQTPKEREFAGNSQLDYLNETEWVATVDKTVDYLKTANDLSKVVLARQLRVTCESAYQVQQVVANLREQQPNTYLYYLGHQGTHFLGATPERLLSASVSELSTAALAGSTPRGKTRLEDEQLGQELLNDPKNIGEHGIVVQRLLAELAPISKTPPIYGTVELLKNRDIQHLYLPISIKREAQTSFVESIQMLHPTPALGGEPKELALDWISQNEPLSRGLYGGPIGWLDIARDTGEFAVAIRSGVFQGNTGLLYAGCGVVSESVPDLELKETAVKFKPMLRGVTNQ